ncbi:MAG: SDR family oxidoreductase [Planctomycetota bacterium]|nr:SDR family oxidoreductase [Planctomycetota bacterium]
MSLPFEGRVALVTGSTRGIGRAIALRLAAEGADICVHGRQGSGPASAAGDETLEAIRALGRKAELLHADIASKASVTELMEAVEERFGRLDLLVLNAARAPFKETWRLLERDLRQLVDTNLLGNVFCVQKALPLLEREGGSIVFLSSLGSRFMNHMYPLGPMKAAMESMVRQWAEELGPKGIRSNAVCGGLVKTDAFKTLRRVWPELDQLPERFFVTPEEVAEAVAFLAGPAGAGIQGQTVVVDRGLSNRLMRSPEQG